MAMVPMVHLDSQGRRHRRLGGRRARAAGAGLGCYMGGQWARLFHWACRAAQGRQARSEEAHEPSSATAEGRMSLLLDRKVWSCGVATCGSGGTSMRDECT